MRVPCLARDSMSTLNPWFWEVMAILPGGQVLHRVVGAVVAELQLVCPAAQGKTQHLLPEADAEHRNTAQEIPNGVDDIGDRLGVARTVGEDQPIRLESQDVV